MHTLDNNEVDQTALRDREDAEHQPNPSVTPTPLDQPAAHDSSVSGMNNRVAWDVLSAQLQAAVVPALAEVPETVKVAIEKIKLTLNGQVTNEKIAMARLIVVEDLWLRPSIDALNKALHSIRACDSYKAWRDLRRETETQRECPVGQKASSTEAHL